MKLVYIAGSFRGISSWDIETNIRVAECLGFEIAQTGAVPVIPHTMYRFWNGTQTDEFWLNATMDILRRCDAIFMCENWLRSEGSKDELKEAKRLGLEVFYQENSWCFDDLKTWIKETEAGV